MPSFSKTLGDYISLPKSKRDKVSKPLDVGVTPLSLIAVGAKPLPVVINPNDVDKCLAGRTANKNKNSHELTFKELKALPELIANPVMIFKDPRNENYIGIISDTFDKNGNPLLIAIELNFEQERHMVNRVASVHGRPHAFENFVARNGNEVQGFIPRNIAEGNLLAVNIEKATNFFQSTGLHLPERKDSFVTFDNTITHSLDSVKRFEEKNLQEDIKMLKDYRYVYMEFELGGLGLAKPDELEVYRGGYDNAFSKDEMRIYALNQWVNQYCAEDIDAAIENNPDNLTAAVSEVCERYGEERVYAVLGMNVEARDRMASFENFSEQTKEWGAKHNISGAPAPEYYLYSNKRPPLLMTDTATLESFIAVAREREKSIANFPGVYVNDFDYAREHDELKLYHESRKINNECAKAIDAAISKHSTFTGHGGGRYVDCEKALDDVVEQYGSQRVFAVVAHTVDKHSWDGRMSPENKDWAKTIETPKIDYIPLDTHLTIFDSFADKARNTQMALAASETNTAESIKIEVSPEMREVLTGLSDAMKKEEKELYRDCATAIDAAIEANTKPGEKAGTWNICTTAALKSVTEEYGTQRVNAVLAANIKYNESDKRITAINKKWAEDIVTPDNIPHLKCHTSTINDISKKAREAEQQTEQARETEDSEDMER